MQKNGALNTALKTRKNIKTIKFLLKFFSWNGLIIGLLIILGIVIIGAVTGSSGISSGGSTTITGGTLTLSPSTLKWQDEVMKEAKEQEVEDLVPYIMAIIEVESKGILPDVMQSSESAGLPPNTLDSIASIKQGIKYLKSAFALGESLGIEDYMATVQSYNFGTAYISYLATQEKTHSVDIAEKYSRDVVAPSLGNTLSSTYSYVNAISQANGKTYLYRNGGNFHYAYLVQQYVGIGNADSALGNDVFQTILNEGLKYEGNPYVWGGYNPDMGFDCSGFVQWVYAKAGISLPRTASEQYSATEEISPEEAKPGDLIFFKGTYGSPEHISHIGIYIDETRMYDSNGSGVGYHYWNDNYWSKYYAGIRRVLN